MALFLAAMPSHARGHKNRSLAFFDNFIVHISESPVL